MASFEGKCVILKYREWAEWDQSDDECCLLYRVENGQLKPIIGVLDLPEGSRWHCNTREIAPVDQLLLEVVEKFGITEVYTPLVGVGKFLGQDLGEFLLTENEDPSWEIELLGFDGREESALALKQQGVKIWIVDNDTHHIIGEV